MMVGLLSLLYAIAVIDRLILSVLIVPIKAELLISDTQVGVLFGLSFAVLFSLAGLPLARIADTGSRKALIVSGVAFWSASTAASAFAWNFETLLLCRAGVAIGEAVLTPAAISIIGDLFPRERRDTPTATYMSVGAVTGMSAAAIGGLVLAAASTLSASVDGLAPWRLSLLLVGAPGFALALVYAWAAKEPERGQVSGSAPAPRRHSGHLREHGLFYACFFGAVGLGVAVSYGLIGWTPTMLVRRFGMDPSHAGYVFGSVGVVCGVLGTLGAPRIVAGFERRGRPDGVLLAGMLMCLAAMPAVVVAGVAQNLVMTVGALAVALAALPGLSLMPSLVIQRATPPHQRGQLMALAILAANLLGLGVGPALVGYLSDTAFSRGGGAGSAIAAAAGVAFPLAIALFLASVTPYRRLRASPDIHRR